MEVYLLFLSNYLFHLSFCQVLTNTTNSDYSYSGTLGMGWGTISVIIAIVFGILTCIYGSSTQAPK